MPPVGLEPEISAGERPQTYALDRAATGTGGLKDYVNEKSTETSWDRTSVLPICSTAP